MKEMMYKILRLALAFVLVLMVSVACVEELESEYPVNSGTCSDVAMDLSFTQLIENDLGTKSGLEDAASINGVNDLSILFYEVASTQDPNPQYNSLSRYFYFDSEDLKSMMQDEPREPGNDDEPNSESPLETDPTKCIKTVLESIDFGTYHIYAVANMGNIGSRPDVANEASFCSINLTWNQAGTLANEVSNVRANNVMSGFFDNSGKKPTRRNNYAPDIVINKPRTSLHAWLRRSTAKITIAFDGTRLNESIFIYLRSAKIVDGRRSMPLIDNNDAVLTDENKSDFFVDPVAFNNITDPSGTQNVADMITYYPEGHGGYNDYFDYWPRISSGNPTYGSHTGNNARPMFCFENLQGYKEDKTKPQDYDRNGALDRPGIANSEEYWDSLIDNDYDKDDVASGTYIEVEAFYRSNLEGNIGTGKIKYRFMLGEDIVHSFDVERNHHYKLTLVFNGNANDVDWHIEYVRDYGMYVPNPYYISYLYNETMTLPLDLVGEPVSKLKARILKNDWFPTITVPTDNFYYYDTLKVRTGMAATYTMPARAKLPASEGFNPQLDGPWHGFLSLFGYSQTALADVSGYLYNTGALVASWAEEVVKENSVSMTRGYREYKFSNSNKTYTTTPAASKNIKSDSYSIVKTADGVTFNVPFYTNPLTMLIASGYSGNNPYYTYQRKAKVEFSIDLRHPDATGNFITKTYKDTVTIYQVRRVINPKGVYRSAGNDNRFKVIMAWRTTMDAADFHKAESEGPWSAFIESGEGWHLMDSTGVQRSTVTGKSGSKIIFYVKPNSTIGPEAVKCAVVKITYHNNTCVHKVILHQGDSPVQMVKDGVYWHMYNLEYGTDSGTNANDTGVEADRVTEEGSLFRNGNIGQAIDAINNQLPAGYLTSNPIFKDDKNTAFVLAPASSNRTATWSQIRHSTNLTNPYCRTNFSGYTPKVVRRGTSYVCKLPAASDFYVFRGAENFEYGFGIIYGDNANETRLDAATTFNSAWYNEAGDTGNGMRGCFVYNKNNGLNLFFPIGVSGFAHRSSFHNKVKRDNFKVTAALRYAQRGDMFSECDDNPNTIPYRPQFETIYTNLGAIYWTSDTSGDRAWDINFTTFDFNGYAGNALVNTGQYGSDGSDACMIRLVQTAMPTGHTQTAPDAVIRPSN